MAFKREVMHFETPCQFPEPRAAELAVPFASWGPHATQFTLEAGFLSSALRRVRCSLPAGKMKYKGDYMCVQIPWICLISYLTLTTALRNRLRWCFCSLLQVRKLRHSKGPQLAGRFARLVAAVGETHNPESGSMLQ